MLQGSIIYKGPNITPGKLDTRSPITRDTSRIETVLLLFKSEIHAFTIFSVFCNVRVILIQMELSRKPQNSKICAGSKTDLSG